MSAPDPAGQTGASTVTLGRLAERDDDVGGTDDDPGATRATAGSRSWRARAWAPSSPGVAHPLGATVTPTGVNFGVYAKHATGIDIQFFYAAEDLTPTRVVTLDPAVHRTGEYWHALVPGVGPGTALRLRGAWSVGAARTACASIRPSSCSTRTAAASPSRRATGASMPASTDDMATTMKSVVTDTRLYDWEGDAPLNRPWRETVVYEAHLAGMTRRSRRPASRPSCAAPTPA